MKNSHGLVMAVIAAMGLSFASVVHAENDKGATGLKPWREGFLDIYHINTGRGNAAFFIFPDGTTMLFDAGEINVGQMKGAAPLKLAEARPDGTRSAGEWIGRFVRSVAPSGSPPEIDYAVISHFHSDHYGHVSARTPLAGNGAYKLSGITEVGDIVPIRNLIDRGYPDYDFPMDLTVLYGEALRNYRNFADYHVQAGHMRVQRLVAGGDNQIVLRKKPGMFPAFVVHNVKSNGMIWTGRGVEAIEHITATQAAALKPFTENPLSLALKISYGPFDYFTGGDTTGLSGFGLPGWFDVETPVAATVGRVEALTLNHHGNRDATNAAFLSALAPRVIVQQSWISDQPGGEVVHRMASESLYDGPRDIFSTNMLEETKVAIGPWMTKAYQSFEGHILIRVSPGGADFQVLILDDRQEGLVVKAVHGPYPSN